MSVQAEKGAQQDMAELQQSSSIAPLSMTSSNETTPATTTADNGSATAIRAPSSVSPASDQDDEDKLALDRVHLTLLLVSGNRHHFEFDPVATVSQVKKHVITEWPEEWETSRAAPKSVNFIELLYLGKFLENDSTLESNRLRGGESFTVHLLVRDQQLKSADDSKDAESVPRCKCCIIL
ncbi:ubiquitin-2 like Rad60 SUMO-like-domain-containing protein [Fennellomyces sp. T-0311]|nr:ubiquitin-2 like Rad60 SUMO-like-domain-containing protein [Fennellomyces sp. T-0311]